MGRGGSLLSIPLYKGGRFATPLNKFTQLLQALTCLEDSTVSNPVHTSVTRMCGDKNTHVPLCLEGST